MKKFIFYLALTCLATTANAGWEVAGKVISIDSSDKTIIGDNLGSFKILNHLNSLNLASTKKVTVYHLTAELLLLKWKSEPGCAEPLEKYLNAESATAQFYYGQDVDEKYSSFYAEMPVDCSSEGSDAKKVIQKRTKKLAGH